VPNEARRARMNRILIDSFSPTGSNSALAIGRHPCPN
jgi:hypothetical protein